MWKIIMMANLTRYRVDIVSQQPFAPSEEELPRCDEGYGSLWVHFPDVFDQ